MARPRIVFVEHQPSCPPALFARWAADLGVAVTTCRPYAGDPLPEPAGAGLVVLGGSMSATDGLPWFGPLADLLRAARDIGTPTLGICLGHQLIAAALGGRVEENPAGMQLGVRETGWTDAARDDVLLGPLAGAPVPVAHWNDDIVTVVPEGSVVLARSEGTVQALRHGPRLWGVQWHPEADQHVLSGWAALDADRLAVRGLDADLAVARAARLRPALDESARRLVEGFVAVVRES